MNLDTLLAEAMERKASDIHLVAGEPPVFRVAGALLRREETPPLDAASLESLLLPALPEMTRIALIEGGVGSAETVLSLADREQARFSLLALRTQDGGLSGTIRLIPLTVPTLEQIGGADIGLLTEIAGLRRGLVLFTGPTGSGKLTTAAAVLDHINRERAERIYVLEEIPGYFLSGKRSIITTLRVGGAAEFDSYERAAQALQRGADPDIVLFSDLPTVEAARQALLLAETGHLVLATLTAESAAQAIGDLVNAFPEPREALRSLVARTLAAVFHQRLLPRAGGRGRVAAYELLRATPDIQERILRGASSDELYRRMAESDGDGDGVHRTLNAALDALVAAGTVTEELAGLHRRPQKSN